VVCAIVTNDAPPDITLQSTVLPATSARSSEVGAELHFLAHGAAAISFARLEQDGKTLELKVRLAK